MTFLSQQTGPPEPDQYGKGMVIPAKFVISLPLCLVGKVRDMIATCFQGSPLEGTEISVSTCLHLPFDICIM